MNTTRRSILKGASWAAPVAAVAVAAPALAVSPDPGLSGLLRLTYSRSLFSASIELTTEGRGLGLRVADSIVKPTSAKLTIYLSRSVAPASTRWSAGRNYWTLPLYVRTEGDYTVWETSYTGTWAQEGKDWTPEPFTFTASAGRTSGTVRARVVREAVVNGATYTTDSGYVTIGGMSARSARRAAPAPSDGGGEQTETLKVEL